MVYNNFKQFRNPVGTCIKYGISLRCSLYSSIWYLNSKPNEIIIPLTPLLSAGISLTATETRNQYTMRALNTQWKAEDEQFAVLLSAVNRLAQIDRSLYYSPRKAGDTLFDMKQ